jgi:hypothetical protein
MYKKYISVINNKVAREDPIELIISLSLFTYYKNIYILMFNDNDVHTLINPL